MSEVAGFSQAFKAHGLKKVAWLSLSFFGVILTTYHSYEMIKLYFRHPFLTTFSLEAQDELSYPFIALSSTRVVDCDKLEREILTTQVHNAKGDFTPKCWIYYMSQCERIRMDLVQKCNDSVLEGALTGWRVFSDPYVPRGLNVLAKPWKESILTHPADFVVESKWEGTIVPVAKDLRSPSDHLFASAYYQGSLQYIVNYIGELKSAKFGGGNGLELTLKIPQTTKARYGVLNEMEGFILNFVPPRYISGAKRIFVKPGTFVSIGLRQVQHKKLTYPFASNCIHHWNETSFGGMTVKILNATDKRLLKYHPQSCQAVCRINWLVDKCGCSWSKIDPSGFSGLYSERKCKEFQLEDLDCLKRNDITMDETVQVCNCRDACEVISYDVTYSTLEWPSFPNRDNVAQYLKSVSNNLTSPKNEIEQLMMKNEMLGQLARVNTFFESNQRTIIEESAIFESFWSFFISWGGAMSIYLGISVMTLVGLVLSLFQKIQEILFGTTMNN